MFDNRDSDNERIGYPVILKTENSVYYASFMSVSDFGDDSSSGYPDYVYIPIEPEIFH